MRGDFAIAALALLISCACATTTSGGARDVKLAPSRKAGDPVSQTELQQDVQRVVTAFMEQVAQVGEPAVGDNPDALPTAQKDLLMRRALLYASSAVDIATGPFPEVNTLDMVVFATLCRGALERHWLSHDLGKRGELLKSAFTELEQEAWGIAGKILDAQQQAELREQIAGWQRDRPGQSRVEFVRFHAFSGHAGTIDTESARKARGLLGQVKSATRTADQALLISERVFFASHRLPFLIRLQARIGVQETLTDTLGRLNEADGLVERLSGVRPLVADLSQLTNNAKSAAYEARLLAAAVEPHVRRLEAKDSAKPDAGLTETLASANRLTQNSIQLVRDVRTSLSEDPAKTLTAVEQRADRLVRRWMVYALMLGLTLLGFYLTGSYLVRRLTR